MKATSVASIRSRLNVTQAAMARGIGVTQGNVSFYEKGQTIPPSVAKRLIEYARKLGHCITFDDIYGEGVERTPAVHSSPVEIV